MSDLTDADHRLAMCDSHFRGPALLAECQAEEDDAVVHDLLGEWWNMCDAFKDSATGLRQQLLRVQHLGMVSDGDDPPPSLPVTVYRGAWDDDEEETALSWTLNRRKAEDFAYGLVGMRAKLVYGIVRPDNVPTVWEATCVSALGWFTGRGEEEVIVGEIRDRRPIAQLQKIPSDA